MNIPQSQIDLGKKALHSLWDDKVTVTRKQKANNVLKDVIAYTDVKCHLSQGSQSVLNQTSTIATTTSIFTLYVDTDIVIKTGDTLVITHKSQVFKGIAGQQFNGCFSNTIKVESIS